MRFTSPLVLILLLLLPLVAALGWPARGYGRRREIGSLALRLFILICLILSLAGFSLNRNTDNLAVVFLLDISDSMNAAAKMSGVDYIRQALDAMGPDDQAALVVFGEEALVDRPMSANRELRAITSIPVTNQTDLAEAIHLGLALYPPDTARRMVILSDGAVTTGDTEQAARLAASSGVEIVVVPLSTQRATEVLISEVDAPSHLRQGERFDLNMTLEATQPVQTTVRVLGGGKVIYEGIYELDRGEQTFSLPLNAGEPGFIEYQVQIEPQADTYYQNNELAAYSQVEGPPKILLIAPPEGETLGFSGEIRPDEYTHLLNALEATAFSVESARPSGLPSEVAALAEYAAVILVDVPARQLNQRQMLALQSFVRDLGGGLVTIGGLTSYGIGGYFRTPLEETLPLEMQIKDDKRRPSLAMVFIIDHSGSMSETSGGVTKLELAKEAAIRSVDLLAPNDRVGVIAFDESASWVVSMTDLEDPDHIVNAIASIRSGGGTDIMAGLQAMASVLPDDPATVKHVILLTDGGADPTGIPELVEMLYNDYGITLTTVGVGRDAAPFLPQIAELGGGRYHFTADPGSIPSIFTEETTLATRAYIVEEQFTPQILGSSPILSGINEIPPLFGYVGTSAKDTAQTVLISHQNDPVLAAWQYGLGKAVAFTSDASGRWARAWLDWDGFPGFWAQVVGYTVGERIPSPLEISIIHNDEVALLVVDAIQRSAIDLADTGDVFLNGYTMKANLIASGGEVTTLDLAQVAPGRYQASFRPEQEGVYLVRVSGQSPEPGSQSVAETGGWVLSYSPEYRHLESHPDFLYHLAVANGGGVASGDPGEAFAHTLSTTRASRPVWPGLLALAAILLPFDVAVRRLTLTRSDLRRAWQRLITRTSRLPSTKVETPQRAPHVGTLLEAKERLYEDRKPRESLELPQGAETTLSDQHHAPALRPKEVITTREIKGTEEVTKSPPSGDTDGASPSTASRLLARKRSKQEGDQRDQ